MSNLLVRTITGIVLVLIVFGSILLNEYSLLGLTLVIFTLALYEFKLMFRIKNPGFFLISLLTGILAIAFAFLNWSDTFIGLLPIITLALFLSIIVFYYLFLQNISLSELGLLLLGLAWIGGSLIFFIGLGWIENPGAYKPNLLIILLALIWVNDIAAFMVGSLLGKRKLAPEISPAKTWEGFIAGIMFTILAGYVVFLISNIHSALFWLLSGLVISLAATAGDLFESKMKREAGVKDSGNMIPGHGGILDRFDSLLFSAPLFYLVFLIYQ